MLAVLKMGFHVKYSMGIGREIMVSGEGVCSLEDVQEKKMFFYEGR